MYRFIYVRIKGVIRSWTETGGSNIQRDTALLPGNIEKGNNYDICAVYETGSTGIYSFSYNDEFIVNEYWHERKLFGQG